MDRRGIYWLLTFSEFNSLEFSCSTIPLRFGVATLLNQEGNKKTITTLLENGKLLTYPFIESNQSALTKNNAKEVFTKALQNFEKVGEELKIAKKKSKFLDLNLKDVNAALKVSSMSFLLSLEIFKLPSTFLFTKNCKLISI